jgi:hypothetical protein
MQFPGSAVIGPAELVDTDSGVDPKLVVKRAH